MRICARNSVYLNSLSLINKVSMARASAAFSTWATLWECQDTKVVGYQCERMRPLCLLAVLVHHHSPIEGSVRFMLEHLIEIFQHFHLSCCLKVKHKLPHCHFFQCESISLQNYELNKLINHRIHSYLSIRKPTCNSGIRKNFCKTIRILLSFLLVMWLDCFILRAHRLIPLSEYLWPDDEWTSMNLGRFSSRTLLSCRTASLKR